MGKWLASVQSLEEAQVLMSTLPDILDMKNPAKGALGAMKVETVGQIVKLINGSCQTSATIGDQPMQAEMISTAMINMASSGVDFIKIGLFPDSNLAECLLELAETVKNLETPVIAVIFADRVLEMDCLPLLKSSGFYGVMVDTATKDGQHLLAHWDLAKVAAFIRAARKQDLLCGLAGALRHQDISALRPLEADYLGFRSALCKRQLRTATIVPNLAQQIRQAIQVKAETIPVSA